MSGCSDQVVGLLLVSSWAGLSSDTNEFVFFLYQENNVFYGHHAKIVCLAWSPDNEHFASGGMDMMVYVWTLSDPETKVKIQGNSHLGPQPVSDPGYVGFTRNSTLFMVSRVR